MNDKKVVKIIQIIILVILSIDPTSLADDLYALKVIIASFL